MQNTSENFNSTKQDLNQIKTENFSNIPTLFKKMKQRIAQNEFFGEFDLFGSSLSLNFQGQENYKTQFGGIITLIIAATTIFLTMVYMFPDGLTVNSIITQYSVSQPWAGKHVNLFQKTDNFIRIFVYNRTSESVVSGEALAWFLPNVSAFQVITTISGNSTKKTVRQLEIVVDYEKGYYYLNNTVNNKNAMIYTSANENATIRILPLTCKQSQIHPIYGACSQNLLSNNIICADFPKFTPTTDNLEVHSRVSVAMMVTNLLSTVYLDGAQFITNSKFFGYMTNIFNYQINYFDVFPAIYPNNSLDAVEMMASLYSSYKDECIFQDMINRCPTFDLVYSGTMMLVQQKFDDITDPMLFLLSLSQTIFIFIYLGFLRNYNNNCFKLALADELVYILDENGRDYKFKGGFQVFLACLWHNHFLVQFLDWFLYRFRDTESHVFMPILTRKAIDMIKYTENCLSDQKFFSELNELYQNQGVYPTKIIFDYQKQEKSEDEEDQDEPQRYFQDDDIKEQAFRRMCEQHGHYKTSRRLHLRDLIVENKKKFRLVVMKQKLFQKYCEQIRKEKLVKEVEIPVSKLYEEASGYSLQKKESF